MEVKQINVILFLIVKTEEFCVIKEMCFECLRSFRKLDELTRSLEKKKEGNWTL
jgi:hypothetical protein